MKNQRARTREPADATHSEESESQDARKQPGPPRVKVLGQHRSRWWWPDSTAWRIAIVGVVATLVAAVPSYLTLFQTQEASRVSAPAKEDRFFRRVDANVTEAGGAGVYESADRRHEPVERIKRGHGQEFVGFCIGESVRSASNGLPDDIWLVLGNDRLVAAAMIDGNPPSSKLPTHCAGELAGPTKVSLTGASGGRHLTLYATALGTTLIGFAVRTPHASRWVHLRLVASARGMFSEKARVREPLVAIAVACWASGAPALTSDMHEYVYEPWEPNDAPPELRTEATSTVPEAADVACSRQVQEPPTIVKSTKPSPIKQRSPGPQRSDTSPVTTPKYPQPTITGTQTPRTSTTPKEDKPQKNPETKSSEESELRGSPAPSK